MGERVRYYDVGFDKAFDDILEASKKRCGRILNSNPLVLELRGSACRHNQPSIIKLDETPEQILIIEGEVIKRYV